MSSLLCEETLSLVHTPPHQEEERKHKRARAWGSALEFDRLAPGAQTPPPSKASFLAEQHVNGAGTPSSLDETSDGGALSNRNEWAIARRGIAALLSALDKAPANDAAALPETCAWRGIDEPLQPMYSRVAQKLRDALLEHRQDATNMINDATCARYRTTSIFERAERTKEINQFLLLEQALSEGWIHFFVAQALDWTSVVQQSSACVAQNISLEEEEVFAQTLALACVSLALVCKTFHSDMDVDVEPERGALAKMTHCSVRTLDRIEMLLMRALDYRFYAMIDCFTLLAYHSETLPITEERFLQLRSDMDAVERIGDHLYRMITVDIYVCASMSPWVRLAWACIIETDVFRSIPAAEVRKSIHRVAPTTREAESLCSLVVFPSH